MCVYIQASIIIIRLNFMSQLKYIDIITIAGQPRFCRQCTLYNIPYTLYRCLDTKVACSALRSACVISIYYPYILYITRRPRHCIGIYTQLNIYMSATIKFSLPCTLPSGPDWLQARWRLRNSDDCVMTAMLCGSFPIAFMQTDLLRNGHSMQWSTADDNPGCTTVLHRLCTYLCIYLAIVI